jgi:RHS repeat-associated protein
VATTFDYTALNQVKEIVAPGSDLVVGYGPDGLRAIQNSDLLFYGKTYYLNDGGVPVAELNGSGTSPTVTGTNTFGPTGLLSRDWDGASLHYSFDPMGNASVGVDDSGSEASKVLYNAYGWQIDGATPGSNDDPWGYGAQGGADSSNGDDNLVLMGYRHYDAHSGRFLTRDPIGYAGGINLYSYVGNNPVNFSDPSGLWKLAEPSTWFDDQGYQGSGLQLDPDAWYCGVQGAKAAIDGIIPFWDPIADAGGYDPTDSSLQFSWKAGAFARDILLMPGTPNFSTWAKSPLYYEIGQKTLVIAPEAGISAIERGRELVSDVGWLRALRPEGAGWRLGIGKTFGTGPTPGGWLGVISITQWGEKLVWKQKNRL